MWIAWFMRAFINILIYFQFMIFFMFMNIFEFWFISYFWTFIFCFLIFFPSHFFFSHFFLFVFWICCSYVVFEFVWKWWLEPKYRLGFAYININEKSRKIMGLAEVQIWNSLNVYWGFRKKTDGLEFKYRFGFAYIFL